ncbi:MAG: hypothetical protein ACREHG_06520, partial [Candidatus Saccharimonadales bacterium]
TPYTINSNPFSPPAKSIIIVIAETGAAPGGVTYDTSGTYPTLSDNLATHLTWTRFASQVDNAASPNPHRIAAWWAYAGDTAPGSITLSSDDVATSGQIGSGGTVSVKVWDRAKITSPIGSLVTSNNSGSITTLSVDVTPEAVGSAIFLAATSDGAGNSSAGAGMTVTDTSGAHYIQEWSDSFTVDLSTATLTQTVPSASEFQYIAYEVLAEVPDASVTPSVISANTSIPAPTVSTGVNVTATAIAASISIPAPTVQTSGNADVTPTAIVATTSIPAPGISTGTGITITAIDSSVSVPTPGVIASSVIAATALSVTTSIPAPTVQTSGSADVTPSAISASVSIPTPSIVTGATVTPSNIAATTNIPSISFT